MKKYLLTLLILSSCLMGACSYNPKTGYREMEDTFLFQHPTMRIFGSTSVQS